MYPKVGGCRSRIYVFRVLPKGQTQPGVSFFVDDGRGANTRTRA